MGAVDGSVKQGNQQNFRVAGGDDLGGINPAPQAARSFTDLDPTGAGIGQIFTFKTSLDPLPLPQLTSSPCSELIDIQIPSSSW